MDADLRAGIAVYNAGHYHAAHDAWEDRWLDLPEGDDERFLHGLIQFTAAVYHARNRNWSGATGLAESGRAYLGDLPGEYRSVNVDTVRAYLADLARDPERIERGAPPRLTYAGEALALPDLDFESTAVAAELLAEELGFDERPVERAIEFARADLADDEANSRFVRFLFEFVRERTHREVVFRRLASTVEARQTRASDVDGLFEDRG